MYWNEMYNWFLVYAIRLTLTWDVLKFDTQYYILQSDFRLTLTWDVLK